MDGVVVMNLNNVSSIKYNETDNILTVTYQGGSVIDYKPVNPENYTEIVKSKCLSDAVHRVIRHPLIVGINQQRGH